MDNYICDCCFDLYRILEVESCEARPLAEAISDESLYIAIDTIITYLLLLVGYTQRMLKNIFKVLAYLVVGYILFLILAFTIDGLLGEAKASFGEIGNIAGWISLALTIIILGNVKLYRFLKRKI